MPRFGTPQGADRSDDLRRLEVARAAVGPDIRIAVDANQRWDVAEAIEWIAALALHHPYWVEEPTSPDDIGGRRRSAGPAARRSPPVNTCTTG
jgi:L-fuconate dehydratase